MAPPPVSLSQPRRGPLPPEMRDRLAQAVAAHRSGDVEGAAVLYRQILGEAPAEPDVLRLLGLAVLDQGMNAIAVELMTAAANLSKEGRFWADLGRVHTRLGQQKEAESALRRAAKFDPNEPVFLWELGVVQRGRGRVAEAMETLRRLCTLAPDHLDAPVILAEMLLEQGKATAALALLEPHLLRYPGQTRAHVLAGHSHMKTFALEGAARCFQRALAFTPHDPVPLGNLALVRQLQGRIGESLDLYEKARAIAPQRCDLASNHLMTAQYLPGVTAQSLFDLHQKAGQLFDHHAKTRLPPLPDPNFSHLRPTSGQAHRPLRIGYVSSDLAQHPVGFFLSAVLPHHDPTEVEVHVYSGRLQEDAISAALKGLPHVTWNAVAALSNQDLTQRMRADALDIAIDLAGHTARNRLGVFAARVAPVQLTWAGYVGTTGIAAMDGLIADGHHIQAGEEQWYSERVWRMPHGYVPYAPPKYLPAVAVSPAAIRGQVSFGYTNGLTKLNEGTLALWARILTQVPNSRLVLKTEALGDPDTAKQMVLRMGAIFHPAGIEPNRVAFAGPSSHADHLAFYQDIDILLDPSPYSGGLTTLESLWMGVPVITLTGQTFAGRHSTCHLTVAGLEDLCVAQDGDGYVDKAVALASDTALLATLRGSLRATMESAPSADGRGFTRRLEALYRQAWTQWVSQQAP